MGSYFELIIYANFWQLQLGKWIVHTDGFFECGKKVHKINDGPTLSVKERERKHASHERTNPTSPKKNCFYLFHVNKEKEPHFDKGIVMLYVSYIM